MPTAAWILANHPRYVGTGIDLLVDKNLTRSLDGLLEIHSLTTKTKDFSAFRIEQVYLCSFFLSSIFLQ